MYTLDNASLYTAYAIHCLRSMAYNKSDCGGYTLYIPPIGPLHDHSPPSPRATGRAIADHYCSGGGQ